MAFTEALEDNPIQPFLAETHEEYERTVRELQEIRMLVDQSRVEVEKLAQRNASIANHLRQIQANFDTVPRNDIKVAYEAAQDAQQRLFTMRGQLEKLQSDQANLERYVSHMRRTLAALEGAGPNGGGLGAAAGGGAETQNTMVRIVEAQESERQRLSRQMHDGPAQALSNFILQAEIAMRLFEVNPERAKAELANLKASASTTFQRVRDFIFELRPMQLDDLGLVPTVRRYVDVFKDKSGITSVFQFTGTERRLESHQEVTLFRAIQELLANARDHSQASQIKVQLDLDERRVRVMVEDNGQGFDADAALAPGHKTIGLATMKERVELLGGTFEIQSRVGQGSRITLDVPVGSVSAFA